MVIFPSRDTHLQEVMQRSLSKKIISVGGNVSWEEEGIEGGRAPCIGISQGRKVALHREARHLQLVALPPAGTGI